MVHNRVKFVSNHFNDVKSNRVFRVDPRVRYNGKTFAGIGAPRSKNFISTGVPRSDRDVFNAPRARLTPGMVSPPWGIPGTKTPLPWGTPGAVTPALVQGEGSTCPARQGDDKPQPGEETERSGSPHGEGTSNPPSHGSGGAGGMGQGK